MGFQWLERRLVIAFDAYGRFVCRHPLPFLLVPLIFAILVAGGILLMKLEVGVVMLFTPLSAPSRHEQMIAREFSSVWPKPDSSNASGYDLLPYAAEDDYADVWFNVQVAYDDERNVMTPETWSHLSWLMTYIYNNFTCSISHTGDGPRLRYNPDFCNPQRGCIHMEEYVGQIAYILNVSSYEKSPDSRIRLTYPVMTVFNKPFNWAQLIYGVKLNETDGVLVSAHVVSLFLQFQYSKRDVNMAGYAQICMKQMADYLNGLNEKNWAHGLKMHCLSERIMDVEVMRTKNYTLPYLSATIILITLFTILSSLQPGLLLGSSFESLMGVFTIGLSLLASFGFIFICGRFFNAIVIISPFLVMCVGIDNDFLLMAAYRQTNPRWKPGKRLGAAFSEAGPSLTITSITDILCFGIGFLSDTPSVANFCLYTSVSLTFRYIYQLTFFAAIMAYTGKLEETAAAGNGHRCGHVISGLIKDIIRAKEPCEKPPLPGINAAPVAPESSSSAGSRSTPDHWSKEHVAHRFFRRYYAPFLMRKPVRVVVMLVFAAYVVFVIYWASKLKVNISPKKLVVDNSPLLDYFELAERYSWSDAVLAHVFVTKPPDFRNMTEVNKFLNFTDSLSSITKFIDPNLTDTAGMWLKDYLPFLDYVAHMNDHYNDDFFDYITEFLETPDYTKYWHDLRFRQRANETAPLELAKFRFMTFYRGVNSWEQHVELLQFWRSVCAEHQEYAAVVYDHHHLNIYLDQRLTLEPTTVQTAGIAILSMALITAIFMPDIGSVFYICLSFLSVDLGVVGFLSLWNTDLDTVTMVCVLMTIGFSVYYTARICYCYRTMDHHLSPRKKVELTLEAVGWPITQGGAATLLGILPLVFVPSHMVRVFFRTIALMVLIGLFHGLMVVPVVMSSLDSSQRPRRYMVAQKQKSPNGLIRGLRSASET